jgi:pyridoxamine 5'-phosphate oxidase
MQEANLADLRRNYALQSLSELEIDPSPFQQFGLWFSQAVESQITEPNAMILATAGEDGRPAARTVLLKHFNPAGFVFYTNYNSRKGQELSKNPQATLLFVWLPLERQVIIEGKVNRVPYDVATDYYQSRPRESQIGAWASPQSSVIKNRDWLENEYARQTLLFANTDPIPMPNHWGGYCLTPDRFEFWQGRESRLHDRMEYRLIGDSWILQRLAP